MKFTNLKVSSVVPLVMAVTGMVMHVQPCFSITPEDSKYVERTLAEFSSLKSLDAAFERTNAILEKDPGATRARFLFGIILEKQGLESLAMEQYRKCIEDSPDQYAYHYRLLLTAIKTKDSDTMLNELMKCKTLAKGDGHFLLQLGLSMENAGYTKLADPLYEEAARANSRAFGVGMSLARLRLRQGRFDEAIRCVNWDLVKEPYNTRGNILKGQILLKLDKQKEATMFFMRAFSKDPCEGQVAGVVARELVKMGKYEAALGPAFCDFLCNAGNRENLEKAKRFARTFIKKVPVDSIKATVNSVASAAPSDGHRQFFFLAVGGFFDEVGYWKLATSAYESALSIHTNPPNDQLVARGYYRLGLEKELRLREPEEALALYKKSLAIYPVDKEVSLAVERLERRMKNRSRDFAGRLKDSLRKPSH